MYGKIEIFESELRIIAYEASRYKSYETGGDLYGLWTAKRTPVIYLATGPGIGASGKYSEYEMDIDYMKMCESIFMKKYGIQYLGDWHSHHTIGLHVPSFGDRNRIRKLCEKNNIGQMTEIIVNHETIDDKRKEHISAFTYINGGMNTSEIVLLEEPFSPVRERIKVSSVKEVLKLAEKMLPMENIIFNWHINRLPAPTSMYGGNMQQISYENTKTATNNTFIRLDLKR